MSSEADVAEADEHKTATQPSSRRKLRMLVFTREPFPTYRVDVDVLFRELIARGHEIDFVAQADSERIPAGARDWHGRTVWVGPTDTRGTMLHRMRRDALAFWHDIRSLRLARTSRYDAVQVRDKFLIAAIAVVVARARGLKFFYWLSFPFPESEMLRAKEGNARSRLLVYLRGAASGLLLYKWILPLCTHAFVQSEQMRIDVSAHGVSRTRLTPVPMGIAAADVAAGGTHKPRRSAMPTGLTIVYLGTLNPQRRPEMLVDMLSVLLKQGMNARLLLVGDGDLPGDRARIERRAHESNVQDHLEITGMLPRSDALARVRSADIALSPFFPTPVLLSTSPTKLVEYMGLGLPVVANDHPEQRLVLRESRAGVCVPWGAKYFARAVTWLARRGPDERQRMGECGRRWVLANRTYDRIAEGVERTYEDLIGR